MIATRSFDMTISLNPFRRGVVAVVLLGSLTAACATQQTTNTGYLGGAALTPVAGKGGRALAYAAEPVRLGAYTSVIIETPAYQPGPHAPKAPSQADVMALTTAYKRSLSGHFSQWYAITSQPGPGVLRVRAALTGYDLADVAANVVLTPLIGPMANGGAASEAEVVDSVSGERVAALATHTNGSMWKNGPFSFFKSRAHAERALDGHAKQLASTVAATAGLTRRDGSAR
jgi:Protein of unknown function (DUF3313)